MGVDENEGELSVEFEYEMIECSAKRVCFIHIFLVLVESELASGSVVS